MYLIYKKLKKVKLIKTKLNKHYFEVLRNVELICFINPKYIDKYNKFLKANLSEGDENKFYKYLNNTRFKKDYRIYNYYKLFENVNEDNKNLLEHMFLTNNIEESLHSKINYYIPKKKINYNFFNGYY